MTGRLPDGYFESLYAAADDPWQLASRWYEERKYAITMAMLPRRRYRNAFEPGCSIGTLTERLLKRCDHVTALDVAEAAVQIADGRLRSLGSRERVTLLRGSVDRCWPDGPFDLAVLSEVGYYFSAELLAEVLARECPRLVTGATVLSAHWRHPVPEHPLSGDAAAEIISTTPGLALLGSYRDDDVVIEILQTGPAESVATRDGLTPG